MQFYNIVDVLPDEFACFEQLHFIVSMLRLGPTASMSYIEQLRIFIADHHRRFASLYATHVKPKQHHMHHVVGGNLNAGKLLSCFVTERKKHRETKRHAVTTFRSFEQTTLTSVLNAQVQWMTQGHDIFQHDMLVAPKVAHVQGHLLQCAGHAVCAIGSLFVADIVYARDGTVGRIENFWKTDSEGLMVQLDVVQCVHGDNTIRDESGPVVRFVPMDDIVEACIWFYIRPSVIKIALPPIVLLQWSIDHRPPYVCKIWSSIDCRPLFVSQKKHCLNDVHLALFTHTNTIQFVYNIYIYNTICMQYV